MSLCAGLRPPFRVCHSAPPFRVRHSASASPRPPVQVPSPVWEWLYNLKPVTMMRGAREILDKCV